MSPHKFYFKVRGDDKHGKKISLPAFGAGSHTDESLMSGSITKSHPTVQELKKLIFHKRAKNVLLYVDKNSSHHAHNSSTIDITAHGNDKAHPLLFVDKNDDAEEDEDEREEAEAEFIDRTINTPQAQVWQPPAQPQVQSGNICGNPACGISFICNADYNRHVQPMGYRGV